MTRALYTFVVSFFVAFALTACVGVSPQTASAGETVHMQVEGMVCEMCVQSLKQAFLKEPGVQKVDVSLEDKTMVLTLAPAATIEDARIVKLVDHAGYKANHIQHIK